MEKDIKVNNEIEEEIEETLNINEINANERPKKNITGKWFDPTFDDILTTREKYRELIKAYGTDEADSQILEEIKNEFYKIPGANPEEKKAPKQHEESVESKIARERAKFEAGVYSEKLQDDNNYAKPITNEESAKDKNVIRTFIEVIDDDSEKKRAYIENNLKSVSIDINGKFSQADESFVRFFDNCLVRDYMQKPSGVYSIEDDVEELFDKETEPVKYNAYSLFTLANKINATFHHDDSVRNTDNDMVSEVVDHIGIFKKFNDNYKNTDRPFTMEIACLEEEILHPGKKDVIVDGKRIVTLDGKLNTSDKKFADLLSAEVKHLKESQIINKANMFVNILASDDNPVDLSESTDLLLQERLIEEAVDQKTISRKAKDIIEIIKNNKEPMVTEGRLRNRDRFNDYADLFKACMIAGQGTIPNDIGKQLLTEMGEIRIHNFNLSGRGMTQDYINQQKVMDDIRQEIGLPLENKWQSVEKKVTPVKDNKREKVADDFLAQLKHDTEAGLLKKTTAAKKPQMEKKSELNK